MRVKELCGRTKRMRIDKNVFRWFAHTERMGNDRIVKRVYVVEYLGIRLVGRPRKMFID